MKSFKRRQIGGPPQLPVSLSSHVTVVVSRLQGGKSWNCIMSCKCIMSKGPQEPKGVLAFSPTPLVDLLGSSSPRCISGCVARRQWEQEKEIKCHVLPSPY